MDIPELTLLWIMRISLQQPKVTSYKWDGKTAAAVTVASASGSKFNIATAIEPSTVISALSLFSKGSTFRQEKLPEPVNGGEFVTDDTTNNTGGFFKGENNGVAPPPFNNACTGNCANWTAYAAGYNSDMYYTLVNGNTHDSWAKWETSVSAGQGIYEVFVHVPNINATSWQARYIIRHDNNTLQTTAWVDQYGLSNQWVSIGAYYMTISDYVYTTDATGEPAGSGRRLGVDAIKFVRRGTTYLPDTYAANDWSANVTVRNNGGGTAQVYVAIFNLGGGLRCTWLPSVPAQSATTIAVTSGCTATPYVGRVDASQDVAVAVTLQRSSPTWSRGAYAGFDKTRSIFRVPLVMHQLNTADGIGDSQINVQNADTVPATVNVYLLGSATWGDSTYTLSSIPVGGMSFYDLSNLPVGWYGSAFVQSTGAKVAVVAHTFTGPDGLQTLNAFPIENVGTTWLVPLFASRLPNSLSTPVTVQNVSGNTLQAGSVTLACTPDPGASGLSPFSKSNTTAIPNDESYFFNPVTDMTIPANWYGSCKITAGGNVVSFVSTRFVGTPNTAAYEAINANGTDRSASFSIVAERLNDGFATSVTIQNLNLSSPAQVTLRYYGASLFANCTATTNRGPFAFTIPAGGSLIRNHRLPGTDNLPDGWCGSLLVTSSDQPIHGFIQLSNLNNPPGDTFMAHNAITRP